LINRYYFYYSKSSGDVDYKSVPAGVVKK